MKIKYLLLTIVIAASAAIFTGCDGDSGGDGKCQFEGCSKKATSVGGEFCDEHSKRLNDYWDSQY